MRSGPNDARRVVLTCISFLFFPFRVFYTNKDLTRAFGTGSIGGILVY